MYEAEVRTGLREGEGEGEESIANQNEKFDIKNNESSEFGKMNKYFNGIKEFK